MSSWTFTHLESFCMYDSLSKEQWEGYKYTGKFDLKKKGKPVITENKNYIPKSKKPLWCRAKNKENIPQYKCLKSNCPFFAYTDASMKDYKIFGKAYDKGVGE